MYQNSIITIQVYKEAFKARVTNPRQRSAFNVALSIYLENIV
jgi:hypothetical protein